MNFELPCVVALENCYKHEVATLVELVLMIVKLVFQNDSGNSQVLKGTMKLLLHLLHQRSQLATLNVQKVLSKSSIPTKTL